MKDAYRVGVHGRERGQGLFLAELLGSEGDATVEVDPGGSRAMLMLGAGDEDPRYRLQIDLSFVGPFGRVCWEPRTAEPPERVMEVRRTLVRRLEERGIVMIDPVNSLYARWLEERGGDASVDWLDALYDMDHVGRYLRCGCSASDDEWKHGTDEPRPHVEQVMFPDEEFLEALNHVTVESTGCRLELVMGLTACTTGQRIGPAWQLLVEAAHTGEFDVELVEDLEENLRLEIDRWSPWGSGVVVRPVPCTERVRVQYESAEVEVERAALHAALRQFLRPDVA